MSDGKVSWPDVFIGAIFGGVVVAMIVSGDPHPNRDSASLRVVWQGDEHVKCDNHKIIDGMMTSTVDGVVVYFPSNCVFLVGE